MIAGSVAPHWRFAIWAQSVFATFEQQILATVLAAMVFVVTLVVLYAASQALEGRLSNDTVRAAQGLVLSVVSVVLTWFLVAVWEITSEVEGALLEVVGPVSDPEVLIKVLVTFIALAVGYTVTRLTKRSVKYGVASDRITPHQREVAHHIVQILLFLPVITFVVVLWQVPVRSVFLGAGVLGIVLGFAARQTLSGALSGFVILFARPFEVGDWIRVNGREGIVTDVTLYNTQIRTFDEEHVLVPNDDVTGSEVINYSKTERLRVVTEVGIDYDDDVTAAAAIATEAMEACDAVADAPAPDVVLDSFADSAVVLRLRYWIDRPTIQRKLSAQNAVIEAVKEAFETEGIKIPFPQRELMGREEADGLRVSGGSDVSVNGEVERAVRRVHADSEPTEVEEPVEERYGDDGGPDQEPEDEGVDADSEADPDPASDLVEDHDTAPDSPEESRDVGEGWDESLGPPGGDEEQ